MSFHGIQFALSNLIVVYEKRLRFSNEISFVIFFPMGSAVVLQAPEALLNPSWWSYRFKAFKELEISNLEFSESIKASGSTEWFIIQEIMLSRHIPQVIYDHTHLPLTQVCVCVCISEWLRDRWCLQGWYYRLLKRDIDQEEIEPFKSQERFMINGCHILYCLSEKIWQPAE